MIQNHSECAHKMKHWTTLYRTPTAPVLRTCPGSHIPINGQQCSHAFPSCQWRFRNTKGIPAGGNAYHDWGIKSFTSGWSTYGEILFSPTNDKFLTIDWYLSAEWIISKCILIKRVRYHCQNTVGKGYFSRILLWSNCLNSVYFTQTMPERSKYTVTTLVERERLIIGHIISVVLLLHGRNSNNVHSKP